MALRGVVPALTRRATRWLALLLVAASASEWTAPRLTAASAPTALAPEIVTASRTPQPAEHIAATARILDTAEIQGIPALTLDGVLRTVPAFTLFRRSDSLIANPTAQGVSLRGLGPSGASRSLVLHDGVPLNDPFGGWVAWTKVPCENLRAIEVIPGGGATAWGNAALGGVVQVLGNRFDAQTTRASATLGDYGTRSFEFSHTQPGNVATIDIAARAFATDGFSLVAPERRGPIDIAAWSRHRWITARWRQSLRNNLEFAATVRGYEEKRGNGTPYQRNGTREKFGSVTLSGQPTNAFAWHAAAYAQDQTFASTFSGVNATRSAETPASDQFAVPATALGAAWTGTWKHPGDARTSAGLDARFVRGETREHFTFAAGNFTRERVAGGRQAIAGLFALHERSIAPTLRATLGARLDAWRDTDGHRRETDRVTGAVLRNDRYADQDDTEFNPSAGLVWQPEAAWRLRANAQRAFRRPTLNELYRPFRVGANVTEANAALRTESVTSAEVGAEWKWFAPAPSSGTGLPTRDSVANPTGQETRATLTLGATAFWNELRDAVGNVTIARGPGTFPIVGFVAAGGVGRQRLNLERTRVEGVELSARWQPTALATITAEYLYNDATVTRTPIAPTLVGRRIAQVPRNSAALSASIATELGFTLSPRVRWIGRQFEDDENQLILGEVVVADIGVGYRFGKQKRCEVFVNVENLGDARVETGRSADGVVNVGTPRLAVIGFRGAW